MRVSANVQADIIIGGFDPIDIGDRQEQNLTSVFDRYSFRLRGRRLPGSDVLFGTVQGALEASVVEWFQQIVESACLECAQSVLVVGSHEDQGRRQVRTQPFQDVEAVTFRHLHVEKNNFRLLPGNFAQGLHSTAAFAYQDNFRVLLEQQSEVCARQRFVIDDRYSYFFRCGHRLGFLRYSWSFNSTAGSFSTISTFASCRKGMVTQTAAPSAVFVTCKSAAFP